ncbi:MAG: F0F1 ATP synthase subunit B [Verrucomicrobiota bacterium]
MFLNIFLASISGDLMETASSVGKTFGFSTWAFIAQVLSFSIVCAALYKFAYGPILKVLEERRQKIELTYREAAEIKVQVADAERRASDIVSQASSGAHKIVEEAKSSAMEFHEKQMQIAKQEAADLIEKARDAMRREHDQMLLELKAEVARLVVETTAKVIGRVLTPQDQERLIQEASRELAA